MTKQDMEEGVPKNAILWAMNFLNDPTTVFITKQVTFVKWMHYSFDSYLSKLVGRFNTAFLLRVWSLQYTKKTEGVFPVYPLGFEIYNLTFLPQI